MKEVIQQLIEAVNISPNNVPLRMQLAQFLFNEKDYPQALVQYQQILKMEYGNIKAKTAMANIYFLQKNYNTAIVVYEDLYKQNALSEKELVQYAKCLVKENSTADALEVYKKVVSENRNFKDEELDNLFRSAAATPTNLGFGKEEEEDWEDFDFGNKFKDEDEANYFMEKPNINFSHVGGMQKVKEEIALKIIHPLKNPDLYKAFGKKMGGGILLYGPPGCGKTFLAKATAGEIDAKFISIGLHDILDMWMGNSEKNLHQIFEIARKNQPCVLFFDEVDALGASRNDLRQSNMRHVINQFLAEMDGVNGNNEGVLILAATNAPWSVDAAFRRPGRFDRVLFIPPPDKQGRIDILQQLIKDKPVDAIDVEQVANITNEFSGADINALIDIATEAKLTESLAKGRIEKITTKDLLKAAKQHKPTTSEWFSTARNYALYANETGLYNDILSYLNIKE
jgi:SpoVK/Ycf46/Vps4 family AAA+-type ATPase